MRRLKLSQMERKEIYQLCAEDFYDDCIIQVFKERHPSYYKRCERFVRMQYGIPLRKSYTFLLDDYEGFNLDLMYELLEHTNINKERLVH